MRSIALADIIKNVPEFNGFTELELVKPKYDKLLVPIYSALGLDTNKPFTYYANNLRFWSGGTGVGIRAVGELKTDREFINSPMCNVIERIIISGNTDTSLMLELVNLMCHTLNFKAFFSENEEDESEHEAWPPILTEPNWKDTAEQIAALEEYILNVRGTSYREDGSLKTWQEYKSGT